MVCLSRFFCHNYANMNHLPDHLFLVYCLPRFSVISFTALFSTSFFTLAPFKSYPPFIYLAHLLRSSPPFISSVHLFRSSLPFISSIHLFCSSLLFISSVHLFRSSLPFVSSVNLLCSSPSFPLFTSSVHSFGTIPPFTFPDRHLRRHRQHDSNTFCIEYD